MSKPSIYDRVTSKIVADLERGVRPWVRPWSAENLARQVSRPLRFNGEAYHGINVVTLWIDAVCKGYRSARWVTYKQAQELGGQVRKGEQGSPVVYADRFMKKKQDGNGDEVAREIPFLKAYTVFNAEQVHGLPEEFYAASSEPMAPGWSKHQTAENFVGLIAAVIKHGGLRAYYSEGTDHVQLPPRETFRDGESYYATLLHELTHWTKHATRLDRDFGRKRFGDAGYATEELVAELGAAFLCADLGITPEVRDDHAAYLSHWLDALRADSKAIFVAAAHAERAAQYLGR